MSGSTIGGIAGGIVGAFFGAPQLGFMVGSMLGGYISPDKVYGPRLTDAQSQTSTVGIPIAFGYGGFSVKGNLIWRDELKEHKKKKRAGKGGGQTQVIYTYTRSYAIGICEGPIKAIKTIKRNGKVVYEAGANAAGEYSGDTSGLTAASRKFLQKCKIYLGNETQLPDPTIEAVEGIGNVPPHRGMAYVVIKDDDLTQEVGAVPVYEFTVVMAGDLATETEVTIAPGRLSEFINARWPLADQVSNYTFTGYTSAQSGGYTGSSLQDVLDHFRALGWSPDVYLGYSYGSPTSGSVGIGLDLASWGVSNFVNQADVTDNEAITLVYNQFAPDLYLDSAGFTGVCALASDQRFTQSRRGGVGQRFPANPGGYWGLGEACGTGGWFYYQPPLTIRVTRKRMPPHSPPKGAFLIPDVPGYYLDANGQVRPIEIYTEQSGTFRVLSVPAVTGGAESRYSRYENAPVVPSGDPNYSNAAFWQAAYAAAVTGGLLPAGWTYGTQYPVIVSSAFNGTSTDLETIDRSRIALGGVVADLCARSGLGASQYDVAQLTDLLDGYVVATIGGADAFITPLSQAYFFDCAEWDAKLRFVKRGGAATFALTVDDLAERDGDAIEETRVQEVELLRTVTVSYVDPAAGFIPATQRATRRAATVQALAESAVEIPVAMTSGDAAKIADKRIKVAWGEPSKRKFNLPYRFSYLSATDVGTLTDRAGNVHRIRIMEGQEDSGVLLIEASQDEQSAYISNAAGLDPEPPTANNPGLVGGTLLELINASPLRDEDDQVGIYIAAAGQLPGWRGAEIQISTDGGATGDTFAEITEAATIGYTLSALAAAAVDYPTVQTVDVFLPDPPESVDYTTLLRFYNRAVIGDEIIQYQTVTDLGSNTYRLSGLVRNRYDTSPVAHAAGARFVLLDSTVVFVQAQQWMIGQQLWFRAVSFGTSEDAYTWQPYTFAKAVSQTEWQPKMLRAADVGSDIVVTWLGRGRLGTPANAYHSQHFRGYRVTYTNGATVVTHDVLGTTDTLTGGAILPGVVTITVAGLNAITGAGTISEALSA